MFPENRNVPIVVQQVADTPRSARLGVRASGRRACLGLALGILALGAQPMGAAAAPADDETHTIAKVASGTVVFAGKRAISVETERSEGASTEMYLPIDGATEVERLPSLSALNRGDRVRVHYEQTYRDREDGERVILKTVASRVVLLQHAAPENALSSSDPLRSSSTLTSGEE